MTKKELREWFDVMVTTRRWDWEDRKFLADIRCRLIKSSGAEVGDEERAELEEHFKMIVDANKWSCCVYCQKIIALLRQKRTVSKEVVDGIWNDIKERGRYGLVVCLQELGYEIKEPIMLILTPVIKQLKSWY